MFSLNVFLLLGLSAAELLESVNNPTPSFNADLNELQSTSCRTSPAAASTTVYSQRLTLSSAKHLPAEAIPLTCRPGYSPLIRRVVIGCHQGEETKDAPLPGHTLAIVADACSRDSINNAGIPPGLGGCRLALQDFCGVRTDGGGVGCRGCGGNFTARVDFVCYRRSGRYRLCNQHLALSKPDQLIEAAPADSILTDSSEVSGDESCDGQLGVSESPTAAILLTILDLRLKASSRPNYGSYFELKRDGSNVTSAAPALLRLTDSDSAVIAPHWPIYARNLTRMRIRYRYAEQLVEFHPYLIRVQKACHLHQLRWPSSQPGEKIRVLAVCQDKNSNIGGQYNSIIRMLLILPWLGSDYIVTYKCRSDTGEPVGPSSVCLHRYGPRPDCVRMAASDSNSSSNSTGHTTDESVLGAESVTKASAEQEQAVSGGVATWVFAVPTAASLIILLLVCIGCFLLLRWRYNKRDRKLHRQSLVMEALVQEQRWQLQRLRCSLMLPPTPEQQSHPLFAPTAQSNQSSSLETYLQPSSIDAASGYGGGGGVGGGAGSGAGTYYFTMSAPIYESLADLQTIGSASVAGEFHTTQISPNS